MYLVALVIIHKDIPMLSLSGPNSTLKSLYIPEL